MPRLPEAPPRGLARVLLAALAVFLVAPVGMFAAPGPALQTSAGLLALPLVAQSLLVPPRRPLGVLVAAASGAVALWWLLGTGAVLDQTVRTATLLATAGFVLLGVVTRWSLTHRALVALGAATAGTALWFVGLGESWNAVQWWSEFRAGYAMRLRFAMLWDPGTAADPMTRQLGGIVADTVRVLSDLFPALLALNLLAAFGVTAALHHRLAGRPLGRAGGRFLGFRFSEHLGWLVVIPLVLVLLPRLAGLKLAAWNVLTVMGTLYVARGLAVGTVGLGLLGGGPVLAVLGVLAVLFLWPAVLASALMLGVLDTRMDLRTRWLTPRSSE